jgi:hypothetical protein
MLITARNRIKFFMPGQDVPAWLEKVSPKSGSFKFTSPVVIWVNNGSYMVSSVIETDSVMEYKNTGYTGGVTIVGQSPEGSGEPVIINCGGIPRWYFNLLLVWGCLVLYSAI